MIISHNDIFTQKGITLANLVSFLALMRTVACEEMDGKVEVEPAADEDEDAVSRRRSLKYVHTDARSVRTDTSRSPLLDAFTSSSSLS